MPPEASRPSDAPAGADGTDDRRLPDHVTMPLLGLVMNQAMDEDYAHVARRRAEEADGTEAPETRPRTSRLGAAAMVAAFGLLVGIAAVQTSREADRDESSRNVLIQRVQDARERVGDLQAQLSEVRGSTTEASDRSERVARAEREAERRVQQLAGPSGYAAVSGPGVRIVVDDAPSGEADGRVRDADLAYLVDGLWSAGAEAIVINDQRLTPLSSIRNSNAAINVNSRPLTAPYVVRAVGNPRTLLADLATTTGGRMFDSLASGFGLVVEMDSAERLILPAAGTPVLRHAQRLTSDGGDAR